MSGGYHIPPELALFRVVPKQDEKDDEKLGVRGDRAPKDVGGLLYLARATRGDVLFTTPDPENEGWFVTTCIY